MSEGEVFNQNKELMEPWTPGQLFFINCTEEQSMDSLSYCCLYFCLHTPKKKKKQKHQVVVVAAHVFSPSTP